MKITIVLTELAAGQVVDQIAGLLEATGDPSWTFLLEDSRGVEVARWWATPPAGCRHETRDRDGDCLSCGECRCQGCDDHWERGELLPVEQIEARVAPGEPMPAGECPSCGALCHPEEPARVDWLCGCGMGALGVPESSVPENCPLCGSQVGE